MHKPRQQQDNSRCNRPDPVQKGYSTDKKADTYCMIMSRSLLNIKSINLSYTVSHIMSKMSAMFGCLKT